MRVVNQFEFKLIKEQCLIALLRTDGRVNVENEYSGPSIRIEIDGIDPQVIQEALLRLKIEGFVDYKFDLQQYAHITAQGKKHIAKIDNNSHSLSYKYRVSSENPDVERKNLETFLIHVTNSNFLPHGDANPALGPSLLGGPILGDPVFASPPATMAGATMSLPFFQDGFVSASDRYVSVRDNQEPFDKLEKSLDDILSEFAKDHGKSNVLNCYEAEILNTEIRAVKAQINYGLVAKEQIKKRLLPALHNAEAVLSEYPTLINAIQAAIGFVLLVLSLF
ncbi:MAG: hypothetical protein KDE05_15265 [Parvularculaceae bacterium]|nr:hypothetical protein [Parvularculaceae bacterium]